jgi:hypothetical protein
VHLFQESVREWKLRQALDTVVQGALMVQDFLNVRARWALRLRLLFQNVHE